MQNAKCKMRSALSAFCILHFAFVISCGHTTPAPPPPPPQPAPPAVTGPALPSTVDEARQLKTSDPETYERALKAIGTPRALALLGMFQLEQKRWDDAIPSL